MVATIESQSVFNRRCLADQPARPDQSHWFGVSLTSFLLAISAICALVLTPGCTAVERMAKVAACYAQLERRSWSAFVEYAAVPRDSPNPGSQVGLF